MTTNREWLYGLDVADLAEWFDAEHEEPCTSEGEKVQGCMGDAVAIMRDLRGCVDVPMLKDTLCRETGTHNIVRALETLADMVERDYVSRQDFAAQHRTLCAVREQRDEAREQVDAMRDVVRDFRDERDEWKAKFETREFAYKQADAERKRYSEQIDGLFAERDEWRAKAEAKSAERMAAVERLKKLPPMDTTGNQFVNAMVGPIAFKTAQDISAALINLLTDDDAHSKAHSKTEPLLTEQSESSSDEADSREKLEKDLKTHLYEFGGYCFSSREGHTDNVDTFFDDFVFLLDRQATITERELCAECEWPSLAAQPDQEAYDRIAELQAELEDAEAERDELRAENDALLAAHADDVERLDAMGEGELMARVDELQRELDYCRKRYEEQHMALVKELMDAQAENDKLKAERNYWREQVQLCLDSAYPPNHSPERSYDPNVMGYPDRHGCTTPSTLVADVIYGLRDELTDIARTSLALMAELPREDEDA